MTSPRESLREMQAYLARARHAGANLAQDPDLAPILTGVMRVEQLVHGWLLNHGALIEEIPESPTSPAVPDEQLAEVLVGLQRLLSLSGGGWVTQDHLAERIGRPLDFVRNALKGAAEQGFVESTYHYILSYHGEKWVEDEAFFILDDQAGD